MPCCLRDRRDSLEVLLERRIAEGAGFVGAEELQGHGAGPLLELGRPVVGMASPPVNRIRSELRSRFRKSGELSRMLVAPSSVGVNVPVHCTQTIGGQVKYVRPRMAQTG